MEGVSFYIHLHMRPLRLREKELAKVTWQKAELDLNPDLKLK